MSKRLFLFFVLILTLLQGCKQDFKLTAPYKEEMVIYGLVSQQDNPNHYIRIQKGYLLEGNAYMAAGITDSIYYPNILKVAFTGSNANYLLTRVDGSTIGLSEDTGIFANTPNYLYSFYGNLNGGTTYTITVIDTVSRDTVTAQTTTIGSFVISSPQAGAKIPLSNDNPFTTTFSADANAAIFDLTIRLYYNEYSITSNTLTKDTFIDIPAFRSVTPSTTGTGTTNAAITEDAIVKYMANNIPVNTNIYRQFESMDFNFSAGGTELAKFLTAQSAQVNSLASSDALPPYTNINGGLGLFSSRDYQSVTGVMLSISGIDTLACGSDAGQLRFKGSVGQICY